MDSRGISLTLFLKDFFYIVLPLAKLELYYSVGLTSSLGL